MVHHTLPLRSGSRRVPQDHGAARLTSLGRETTAFAAITLSDSTLEEMRGRSSEA
jgi:hypothetical protein